MPLPFKKAWSEHPMVRNLTLLVTVALGTAAAVVAAEERYFSSSDGDSLETQVQTLQSIQDDLRDSVEATKSDLEDQLIDFRIDYIETQIDQFDIQVENGEPLTPRERRRLEFYQRDLNGLYQRKALKYIE